MSKKKQLKEILSERQATHGSFETHSKIAQGLKRVVAEGVSYNKLTDIQKEGLEMVLHKIARIVNGNPNTREHWIDGAGYCTLVADSCTE